MKRLFIWAAVGCVLVVFSLSLSAAPQFGRSKEPQDHTRTLTGRVFSSQDQALARAIVYLKNTKSRVVKTYISDADGTYHFPELSPSVDYEVYAEHDGGRSDTKTLSSFDNRKLVNITLRIK